MHPCISRGLTRVVPMYVNRDCIDVCCSGAHTSRNTSNIVSEHHSISVEPRGAFSPVLPATNDLPSRRRSDPICPVSTAIQGPSVCTLLLQSNDDRFSIAQTVWYNGHGYANSSKDRHWCFLAKVNQRSAAKGLLLLCLRDFPSVCRSYPRTCVCEGG